MILSTGLDFNNDIDWQIEFCEVGSTLTIVNGAGRTLLAITCIPPAKLELLRDRINEEIANGPMLNLTTKRRRQMERPLPLEGM